MELLVVVPGIQGSRLELKGKRVWPPTVKEAIFGYDRIDQLIDDDLVATELIDAVGPLSFYESLEADVRNCGFREGDADKPLLLFPYDWRRSNADTAGKLALAIDKAWDDASERITDITFLAHSMGGLVTRFLVESGQFSDRPWFSRIRRLITLGTPHLGAPKALWTLEGNERQSGLSPRDIRTLADMDAYPSLYELVGPDAAPFTWDQPHRGKLPPTLSAFDETIADRLNLNPNNIAQARAFWSALDISRKPDSVQYLALVGTSLTTIVRNEWVGGTEGLLPIERKDGGDGTVPTASALISSAAHVFSRKAHVRIFEDRRFRRFLYDALGAPSDASPQSADGHTELGDEQAVALSLGDDSYAAGTPIQFVLTYETTQNEPFIQIAFYKCDEDTGIIDRHQAVAEVSAGLTGVSVEEWSFTAIVDLPPGMYVAEPDEVSDDPAPSAFVIY